MPEHFTCAKCGKRCTTDPDWTEEDRVKEAEALYGKVPDDPAYLCDDCWTAFLAWMKERHPDRLNLDALARMEEHAT